MLAPFPSVRMFSVSFLGKKQIKVFNITKYRAGAHDLTVFQIVWREQSNFTMAFVMICYVECIHSMAAFFLHTILRRKKSLKVFFYLTHILPRLSYFQFGRCCPVFVVNSYVFSDKLKIDVHHYARQLINPDRFRCFW